MESLFGSAELTVKKEHLAENIGSGDTEVLSTPVIAALIEKAAYQSIASLLEPDETTVGTFISISHISPTPESMKIYAFSKLVSISQNQREFSFLVEAYDETGLICKGEHKRVKVKKQKFVQKAENKLFSDARNSAPVPFNS